MDNFSKPLHSAIACRMLFCAILSLLCITLSCNKNIGEKISVPESQLVEVVDSHQSSCFIEWGSSVVVIKRGKKHSLVKYRTKDGYGTECDDGKVFMIANEELFLWPVMSLTRAIIEKAEKRAVQKALKAPTPKKNSVLVYSLNWVEVKNPKTVCDDNDNCYSYGNVCSIYKGGWTTEIGRFQNVYIVRYETAYTTRDGCVSGTIFFLKK